MCTGGQNVKPQYKKGLNVNGETVEADMGDMTPKRESKREGFMSTYI